MPNKHGLLAAIGIGSNSVRLLIASEGERLSAVERLETVTRLAAYRIGPDGARFLSEESIRNSCAAASTFAQHASEQGARLLGVVATEAVRAAANGGDLTRALERELHIRVSVISGKIEAALGWQTLSSGYGPGDYLGVIDIGGGSTDLSVGQAGSSQPDAVVSLSVGARTLAERLGLDRPLAPADIASALDFAASEFGPQAAALQPRPRVGVVIGGTAGVLAGMHHARSGEDTGVGPFVDRTWLENWLLQIAALDLHERALSGVPSALTDIVVAGGVILMTLLDAWNLARFHISERNILDGFIERSIHGESIQ